MCLHPSGSSSLTCTVDCIYCLLHMHLFLQAKLSPILTSSLLPSTPCCLRKRRPTPVQPWGEAPRSAQHVFHGLQLPPARAHVIAGSLPGGGGNGGGARGRRPGAARGQEEDLQGHRYRWLGSGKDLPHFQVSDVQYLLLYKSLNIMQITLLPCGCSLLLNPFSAFFIPAWTIKRKWLYPFSYARA